ncbi:MAG: hemerythrin domain-containing protein [Terricaulis sp.]
MTSTAQTNRECSGNAQGVAPPLTDETPCSQSPHDLIPFILERYHATHRRELPELVQLARKVEAVHAGNEDAPDGLSQLLTRMTSELEAHMQKEEQVLFPLLLASGGGCAPFAIKRMRAEHQDHEDLLSALKLITRDFTPPADACGSWRRLYQGCAKLCADLEAHIALENGTLFPQFE